MKWCSLTVAAALIMACDPTSKPRETAPSASAAAQPVASESRPQSVSLPVPKAKANGAQHDGSLYLLVAKRGQLHVGDKPLYGEVIAMAVSKGGPKSLVVAKAPTTTVSGRVTSPRGKPVAGAVVELCAYPRPAPATSPGPCDSAEHRYQAKTASDGTFEFEQVVAGHYGIAARKLANWDVQRLLPGCCGIGGEASVSVGDIRLTGTAGL